jgi:ATP-dependent protease ClpP protease subunit
MIAATADEPAQGASEAGQDGSVQPRSAEYIYLLEPAPRREAQPLPVFPNPDHRPDGSLPPLTLRFHSDVPDGLDVALGRMPRRDTAAYLRAIDGAGNRNILCEIDCAGGDADGTIAIARALLKHPYGVTSRIVGKCSSAAVFIALAADTRTILPDGYILIHGSFRLVTLAQRNAIWALPQDAKNEIDNSLNDVNDACEVLLTSRLGVSSEVARQWMAEDSKWSATEALARGFVDAIAADLEPA